MYKFLEKLVEVLSACRIALSPILMAYIIGAIVFFSNPAANTKAIAIGIVITGIVAGILWATKIWKKMGTTKFISKINEFDHIPKL